MFRLSKTLFFLCLILLSFSACKKGNRKLKKETPKTESFADNPYMDVAAPPVHGDGSTTAGSAASAASGEPVAAPVPESPTTEPQTEEIPQADLPSTQPSPESIKRGEDLEKAGKVKIDPSLVTSGRIPPPPIVDANKNSDTDVEIKGECFNGFWRVGNITYSFPPKGITCPPSNN